MEDQTQLVGDCRASSTTSTGPRHIGLKQNFRHKDFSAGTATQRIVFQRVLGSSSRIKTELCTSVIESVSGWRRLESKLDTIEDNWDGCGADAPNATARSAAFKILATLEELGIDPERVVPSVEGGVGIYWSKKAGYVCIECENDGAVVGLYSDRSGSMETSVLQLEEKDYKETLSDWDLVISA